ncbi:MAG: DUF2520 domain-containing protein [Bacteroidetes bacterium]|nr:DUF2520 domain-containing protein [Bacteroidota bacterium]
MTEKLNVAIIGSGNLAWHLAKHLSLIKKNNLIVANYRKNKSLQQFAKINHCKVVYSLKKLPSDFDIYIICVSDSAIKNVSQQLNLSNKNAVVVHTSGAMPVSEIIKQNNYGVMYPLQSFSKNTIINWNETPILIDANSSYSKNQIKNFSKNFSKNIIKANDVERLNYHLNAVIVNNFTNALFVLAEKNLSKKGLQFKNLLPLINQTVLKIKNNNPIKTQTGPAKRNDVNTINKHLLLLNKNKNQSNLYKQFSKLIQEQQHVKL